MKDNRIKQGQRVFEGCGSYNNARYFKFSRRHYSTLQSECFGKQMYSIKIIFYVWWVVMKLWRNLSSLLFIIIKITLVRV